MQSIYELQQRFGMGIINWNKRELDKIDQETQKLLNMHRGL